jgi:CRP-like cAMP-binding protein
MSLAKSMPKEIAELAAELDRAASSVSLRKGTPLFHVGEPVSGVFVVRKGAVVMSLDGPNDIFPPKTLGPGEIAGLPAALTGTYSLSARTVEDSVLGFVPGRKVTEILECYPRLSLVAMRLMSEEIARVRSALRDIPSLHQHEESAPE